MILVFGTVCMDRILRVPSLPSPGGYVEVQSELTLLGGEAANTANALTSWGDEAVLTANPLGLSQDSNLLRTLLYERNLHPTELLGPDWKAEDVATPVCDIYVTDDGDRTMFGRGFSALDKYLSLDPVPWRNGDWFTAEPNMETASRLAARKAQAEGMSLYLMDFIQPDDPIYPGSYWQSSTDWAGHKNNTQRNVQWVKQFVAKNGCFAVLSDGPNGFVAGSPDLPVRAYPPFPAPSVVDTTGAGDLFRAGMLHGLSKGWVLSECLRFASAAGCLKCQFLGATVTVPTVEQVERHIAENGDVSTQY